MRAMRPCATANAAFAGVVLVATAVFSACSGSPAPAQHLDSAPATSVASPAPPAGPASVDIPAPRAPTQPEKPKKAPETVADCKQVLSEITNEPPGGAVVMNNAATAADAGSSDRLQPLVDVIKARRDGFRCCFDLYARKNPGARGKITWQLKLKPDGTVEAATIVREKSDVTAPEIESCMAELAQSVTWARSPSGKDTTLTYPFDFKPRQ